MPRFGLTLDGTVGSKCRQAERINDFATALALQRAEMWTMYLNSVVSGMLLMKT
jgi:hypothetical protein